MTIVNNLDLEQLTLSRGSHFDPASGMCVMEAASYVAGEPFSGRPECASPVIGVFLRNWNDSLDDEARQMLKPYVLKVVGTRGTPEQEAQRAWMAADWLVRVQAPAWLRLAGLVDQAELLEGMAELTPETVPSIKPALESVRKDARAAGDAAWDAAWDAARVAAWVAAWAAAGAAAGDAAGDAAGAAAGAHLAPTVLDLQARATELLDRMIEVTA